MIKKILFAILVLLGIYAILWVVVLVSCKLGIGSFEPCIWNLQKYWFPFPTCVCVG